MTGNYLVTRLDPEPPPEPEKPTPTVGQASQEQAAAASADAEEAKTATKNDEGASGGKGDEERARTTDPTKDARPTPPKVAFFEDKNKKYLDNIIDRNLSTSLSKFTGIKGDTVDARRDRLWPRHRLGRRRRRQAPAPRAAARARARAAAATSRATS